MPHCWKSHVAAHLPLSEKKFNNMYNQLTAMCMTRSKRRLISNWCQKERVESKLNGQTGSHISIENIFRPCKVSIPEYGGRKCQESIQSSTTPDPGYRMGKLEIHKKISHTGERRCHPFPSR